MTGKGGAAGSVQAPRLPASLHPAAGPLEDNSGWESVDVGAGGVVSSGAADCEVIGSHLRGVRFTGLELRRLRLVDVVLDDCELSGAVLADALFLRVAFNQCRMSGLVAHGLKARDVSWADCKLDDANFRSTVIERSAWRGCLLRQADFYASKLTASSMERCDLTGAQFAKAACDGVSLRGSTLDDIRGAASLRGCIIASDQVIALARPLCASAGIVIDDGADQSRLRRRGDPGGRRRRTTRSPRRGT